MKRENVTEYFQMLSLIYQNLISRIKYCQCCTEQILFFFFYSEVLILPYAFVTEYKLTFHSICPLCDGDYFFYILNNVFGTLIIAPLLCIIIIIIILIVNKIECFNLSKNCRNQNE